MKKALLSVIITGASIAAFAQQPTLDFEGWNGTGANEQPNGWITGNTLVSPFLLGNTQSTFKATSPDVHGGAYAMKIVTVDLVTNPDPGNIADPIGFAATGSLVGTTLKAGFPYTARPAFAEFWYKYAPTGLDTASFFMYLTKWNGTSADTVAWAYWETSAAQSSYTQQTVTLNYVSSTLFPDSAGVFFSATGPGCLTCGKIGSTVWVDDFSLSGWNGVNEHPSSNGVILFPNPAGEFVNISVDTDDATTVVAYDAMGRIVASAPLSESTSALNKKSGTLNTSGLSSGVYSYSLVDAKGAPLRAGTFSVVH